MSEDERRTIEHLCYEAAVGDYDWQVLLERIARWVGGDKAMLMAGSGMNPYRGSLVFNHDPDVMEFYNTHYNKRDPRKLKSKLTPAGEVEHGQNYIANEEIRHTEYFDAINVRGDVFDSVHGVICDDAELGRQAISIQRGFAGDYFGEEELQRMRAILPHLERALRLSARMGHVHGERDGGDRDVRCLIDRAFNIQPLGPCPSVLLASCSGFACHDNRLVCETAAAEATLRHAVTRACQSGETVYFEVAMKPDERLAWQFAQPPDQLSWVTPSEPCALLSLFVRSAGDRDANVVFATAFGLSERESDVLGALLEGQDNRTTAAALGMGYETLRWHLKAIFSKTGYARREALLAAARRCDLSNALAASG